MSQEKLVLLTDPKFCIQTLTNLTRVEKIATRMCTRSAHCSTDIHLQIKGISETKAYVYREYIVFALHEAADVDALHDDFFCEF